MNILIIEDNALLVEQISRVFHKYTFLHSFYHIEDYETFFHQEVCICHFDVVLVDIVLPDANTSEKNGIHIVEYIRKRYHKIPIIIISGISELSILERAFDA